MDERIDPNGTHEASNERKRREELHERIARLHAAVQELLAATEDLEADRQRLLRENRALRRTATLSALIDDLEDSLESRLDEERSNGVAPPFAEHLYQQLPSQFSFPLYFEIVQKEGVDSDTARRCLVHYLREHRLVQSGAYLEKNDESRALD